MDICKVLTEFDSISPSDFSVSLEALNSGRLPDPALFFTWYCEKAREIEKYTGSVEFSFKLLDLALQRIPHQARIAKRFIMATRQSLMRYSAHLTSLAAKLDAEDVTGEEKAEILETLKTIDLKTFEAGSGRRNNVPDIITDNPDEGPVEHVTEFNSSQWDTELQILDFILQDRIQEAFNSAQQGIFFPSALHAKASADPVFWLEKYCQALVSEIEGHLLGTEERRIIFGPEICGDAWSGVVQDFLDKDALPFAEEQHLGLFLSKAKMAIGILSASARKRVKIGCNDDDSYF